MQRSLRDMIKCSHAAACDWRLAQAIGTPAIYARRVWQKGWCYIYFFIVNDRFKEKLMLFYNK